jgi:hypothetical protein
VERHEKKAYKSMKTMTGNLVNLAKIGLSGLYDNLQEDLDKAPTIRPVLDSSGIETGMQNIDSILNDSNYNLRYASEIDAGVARKNRMTLEFNDSFRNLAKRIDRATDTMNNRELNTYITVNGADNPEEFADRFVRDLKLRMRTG